MFDSWPLSFMGHDFTVTPPGTGPKFFWRVFCTDNWGDGTAIEIAEVEFLDSGGTIIPASGGTAIGSDDSAGNEFAKAFDSNAGTAWSADSAPTNQWIGYNFGATKLVEGVRLTTKSSGTNFLTRQPKNCKLEYSADGVTWTTQFSFFTVNLAGGVQTYPITPVSGYHKFWRLFSVDTNWTGGDPDRVIIGNIEFRATAGGADQCPVVSDNNGTSGGRSTSIDGEYSGYGVFDGAAPDTTNFLSTPRDNRWVGMIFPAPIKIEEIALQTVSNSTSRRNMTRNFTLDYRDDDVSGWTTQKTFAAQTAWTTLQIRVLSAL